MRPHAHWRYRHTRCETRDHTGFTGTTSGVRVTLIPSRMSESGPSWAGETVLVCRRAAGRFSFSYSSGGLVRWRTRIQT